MGGSLFSGMKRAPPVPILARRWRLHLIDSLHLCIENTVKSPLSLSYKDIWLHFIITLKDYIVCLRETENRWTKKFLDLPQCAALLLSGYPVPVNQAEGHPLAGYSHSRSGFLGAWGQSVWPNLLIIRIYGS